MMVSTRMFGSFVVLVLVAGCGPRLRRDAAAPPAGASSGSAAAAVDVPLAQMTVQHDASKLDAEHKYTTDGQFTVSGLFYKDGAPKDAVVKVSMRSADGKVSRVYDLPLEELAGAAAKVEMWDDGFLTIVIPAGEGGKPGFETSNTELRAAALEQPGQEPTTCYFGKQVLEGQIRLGLCELQTDSPRLAFVDAVPEAPAPAAAPTSGTN